MTRWPPDRVERLKRLWADGLSLQQIARDLGIKSRFQGERQVTRQADRLGLPSRPELRSVTDSWTAGRVELLKRRWAEGRSAFLIAKELGGVSKNGVIGKVNRLGLPSRKTEERKPYRGRPEPSRRKEAA